MKIRLDDFRVMEGDVVKLKKWPTRIGPVYKSKEDYHAILADHVGRLSERQQLLYADGRYAVLFIFQAMDAAGKDSVIKHVMSGVNPQGCQVFSYRHPSVTELRHNFLWRTTRDLPERGHIGIFNRSYYEEVLIVRVHPEILAGENLPPVDDNPESIWKARYRSITDLERHRHALRTLVHRTGRRQGKCTPDRVPHCPRGSRRAAIGLSAYGGTTSEGVAVHSRQA